VSSAPANNSYTHDALVTISGTAEIGSLLTVSLNSIVVGTMNIDISGLWALAQTLGDGTYTATATATDLADNVSAASNAVTFRVDTVPPAHP